MRENPLPALSLGAPCTRCWNSIGVHGDRSCPALIEHVHCRNCPVYSAGAAARLDADLAAGSVAEWSAHFAQVKAPVEITTESRSVVIFRVGAEWLALPTAVVTEVANLLPIHSLPHRHGGIVLGLASVRGELLVCVSLGRVIGVEAGTLAGPVGGAVYRRLLLIRREDVRAVCPVDEVYGIHRFHPRTLKALPATVVRATTTYSTALLPWRNQSVGLLDDERLFHTMKRSFA